MVIVFKIVVVVFSYLICSICAKNIFDLQRELNGLNIALVIVLGYIFMANLPLTFAYFIIWDTVNYYFFVPNSYNSCFESRLSFNKA